MNITRTSHTPKAAKPQPQSAPAAEKAEEAAAEPKDGYQVTIEVPDNWKKRAISTGVGTVATGAAAFLLGGFGIAGIAAAAAVGGASGAALSSDTAANAYQKFQDYRAERKENARLAEESGQKAEELFQVKLESEAQKQVDSKWALSGEGLVNDMVEKTIAARIQEQAAPKVETQVSDRLEAEVAKRVDAQMKERAGEIDEQVETQVESRIQDRVEAEAADKVEKALAEQLQAVVAERTAKELAEREDEIQSEVDAKVAEQVETEKEERLALRKKVAAHVSDIDLHMKLARSAAKEKWQNGIEPYRDGFEIMSKTTSGLAESDAALMNLALETDQKSFHLKQYLSRSEYMTYKQVATVLKQSTPDKPASTDPSAYLEALGLESRTWDSGLNLMKMGLQVMKEHGDLSASEKLVCEKAHSNGGMDYESEYLHLRNIFKVLAGQDI